MAFNVQEAVDKVISEVDLGLFRYSGEENELRFKQPLGGQGRQQPVEYPEGDDEAEDDRVGARQDGPDACRYPFQPAARQDACRDEGEEEEGKGVVEEGVGGVASDEAEDGAGHAAAGAGDAREKLKGTEDGKDPRERAEGQDTRRVHNGEDKKKKGKG